MAQVSCVYLSFEWMCQLDIWWLTSCHHRWPQTWPCWLADEARAVNQEYRLLFSPYQHGKVSQDESHQLGQLVFGLGRTLFMNNTEFNFCICFYFHNEITFKGERKNKTKGQKKRIVTHPKLAHSPTQPKPWWALHQIIGNQKQHEY